MPTPERKSGFADSKQSLSYRIGEKHWSAVVTYRNQRIRLISVLRPKTKSALRAFAGWPLPRAGPSFWPSGWFIKKPPHNEAVFINESLHIKLDAIYENLCSRSCFINLHIPSIKIGPIKVLHSGVSSLILHFYKSKTT